MAIGFSGSNGGISKDCKKISSKLIACLKEKSLKKKKFAREGAGGFCICEK